MADPVRHHPSGSRLVVLLATGLTFGLSLVLLAFAWPAAHTAPRDVPVGLVAPPPAIEQVRGAVEARQPGAIEWTEYADAEAARAAIEDREVYGAVVLDAAGATVLTASAGSPAIAQLLGQLATGLGEAGGRPVSVDDVVPTTGDDPRGAGLAAAALPLALGGIALAGVSIRRLPSAGKRLLTVATTGVLAGAALAGVLVWVGSIPPGGWLGSAGVIALGLVAVGTALVGLHAVAGWVGFGLGAVTVLLLGNPLSGIASAPEMLPAGWGALGQLLPPGAAGSALRSTAFFDGAAAGGPVLVLALWVLAGLLLCAVGGLVRRSRRDQPEPAPDLVGVG